MANKVLNIAKLKDIVGTATTIVISNEQYCPVYSALTVNGIILTDASKIQIPTYSGVDGKTGYSNNQLVYEIDVILHNKELTATTYEIANISYTTPVDATVTSATIYFTGNTIYHYDDGSVVTAKTESLSSSVTFTENTSTTATKTNTGTILWNGQSKTWTIVQNKHANTVTATTYEITNISYTTPVDATVTSATIDFTGTTTYYYYDKTTSAATTALTSSVTFTENTSTTEEKTNKGTVEWQGDSKDWTIVQEKHDDYPIKTAYTMSNLVYTSPVSWDTTAATINFTGITLVYYYGGTITKTDTPLTSSVTFTENTSTTEEKKNTDSITWNGQSKTWTIMQEVHPNNIVKTEKSYEILNLDYEKVLPATSTSITIKYDGVTTTVNTYYDGTSATTTDTVATSCTETFAANTSLGLEFRPKLAEDPWYIYYPDSTTTGCASVSARTALLGSRLQVTAVTYAIENLTYTTPVDATVTSATLNFTGVTTTYFSTGLSNQNESPQKVGVTFTENTSTSDTKNNTGTISWPSNISTASTGPATADWEIVQNPSKHYITGYTNSVDTGDTIVEVTYDITSYNYPYTGITTALYADGTSEVISETPYTVNVTMTQNTSLSAKTNTFNKQWTGTNPDGNAFSVDYTFDIIQGPYNPVATFRFVGQQDSSSVRLNTGSQTPLLYYAINDGDYQQWDYSSVALNSGDTMYVYGSGNTTILSTFILNGKIAARGNVNELLSLSQQSTDALTVSCFRNLFANCTSLTEAPEMPSTNLGVRCYQGMYSGCNNLVTPPALPALTLKDYCYDTMFSGCTSLSGTPALPATTLAASCYNAMFMDCTNIAGIPALQAEQMASYCYMDMFNGCTKLTDATFKTSTKLAEGCYQQMFNWCSGVTTIPELPATELKPSCYKGMFGHCYSLTHSVILPATTLASSCYFNMFLECKSLTDAKEISATTLAYECCVSMFNSCFKLEKAPVLHALTLEVGCYRFMFRYDSKLNYIKAMFTTEPDSSNCNAWVEAVSSTGEFVKNSAATWDVTASSSTNYIGVPEGWTITTASN